MILLLGYSPYLLAEDLNADDDAPSAEPVTVIGAEERLALAEELAVLKTLAKGVLKTAYANTISADAGPVSNYKVSVSKNLPDKILSLELVHLLKEITRVKRMLNPTSLLPSEDNPSSVTPDTLEHLVANLKPDLRTNIGPAKQAAKFSWPINGEIFSTPGSALREGGAKWPGVLIKSDKSAKVHSIAAGKVVYAGKMKNLGLLVIIDHEDGHLSLYGRNSKILVSQNDRVNKHQIIASIVNLSSDTNTELYFEIRRDGEPVDPRQLCAGSSEFH